MTNQPRGELVPGGLAMVIGAAYCPENIGKIVTLERYVTKGEMIGGYEVGENGWHVSGDLISWTSFGAVRMKDSLAMPENLMPINPSADHLKIARQHEVEA